MSDKKQTDLWANRLVDRQILEEFLEWLKANPPNGNIEIPLIDIQFDKELDRYHGIDRRALDNERKAMLNDYQSLLEGSKKTAPVVAPPSKGGYRRLRVGETRREGDEYYDGKWQPIPKDCRGFMLPEDSFPHRRKQEVRV